MSGSDAQRGFIFQSVIAMIECFERDDWDEIKLEPDTELDKVDIQLYKNGAILSAIQVKSSKNQFERYAVVNWFENLKKDSSDALEICLYLVGDSYSAACETYISQSGSEIKKISFSNLGEICKGKLAEYIKKTGLGGKVRIDDLDLIDASLFSKIHRNSIEQRRLTRNNFEDAFRKALPIHGLAKCLTKIIPSEPEIGLVGREMIVEELLAMLNDTKCIALVSGLGGIGKTAVMQKICESILSDGNDDDHVAWITCCDNLENELLVLCDSLGIPKDIGKEQAFNAVIREMKSIDGILYLFLDDMTRIPRKEELGILNALRPNVRIMITSRHEINGIPHINLTELDTDSSIDMFYGYYGRDYERKHLEDVRRIINSDSVKRHTLLLELLAKAAKQFFGPLDKFRLKLEKKGFFDVSNARLDTGHDENRTIEESVIKLYDITDLSHEKKRIMSLFTIFTPDIEIYGEIVEWAGLNENEVNGLINLGWLVRIDEGLMIHQIVRDSLARQVGDSLRLEEYGELIAKVVDISSYIPRELEYTKVRERLVFAEDVARCFEHQLDGLIGAEELDEKDKELLYASSCLSNSIGGVFEDQGDYVKAIEYFGKAIVIREKVMGSDNPDTASLYNNVALAYSNQGDYLNAIKYYEKALDITEKALGSKHLDTSAIFNNIALVYEAKGDYAKALEFNRKALSIVEQAYGTEHQITASTYNTLASVYSHLGNPYKALECFEKAMVIRERVLGVEHPDTATVYSNIACVFSMLGDETKALEYHKKALSIREKVLGTEHPSTAVTYINLANIYNEHGDYAIALKFAKKALANFKRVLVNNHPSIAEAYGSLAGVFKNKGNFVKALKYYKKALAIRELIFGSSHPNTAETYREMAGVYHYRGENEKALEYYQKALVIYENVFGINHPYVTMVYNSIIAVYSSQGDYKKALKYGEMIIARIEQEPKIDNNDLASVYNNIANVYRELSENEKALEYLTKALAIWEHDLGAEHPSVALVYNNIGLVYSTQGDYKKALKYYKKALDIREKALGTRHTSTATTYYNIARVYVEYGDYAKALELCEKALSVFIDGFGENHFKTKDVQFSVNTLKMLIGH